MDTINLWTTTDITDTYTEDIINEIKIYSENIKKTTLLDNNKHTFDILEKYVYDIALYHFKRLNIDISDNKYIEFWCKDKFDTHCLHVDCDEFEKQNNNYIFPLLTCLTYFNNNDCPTIITDIDMDKYMFKDFEYQKGLFFSFPQKNKHITFDGKYYHGSTKIYEEDNKQNIDRFIIAINLWDKKPKNVEFYLSNESSKKYEKELHVIEINPNINKIHEIHIPNNVKHNNLLNDILYNKYENALYFIKEEINNNENDNLILLFKKNIVKNDNIIEDIESIKNKTITLNRFYQRFTIDKFYTESICNWIINETENYALKHGWTTKRHKNYPTTDLPVETIPQIFMFVLESIKTLSEKIKKLYNLPKDSIINVVDLFIVKYNFNQQNHLDMHTDGSLLTFSISLNSCEKYEGGGTYFEDGIISKLDQGDILIHCGLIKHGGIEITNGVRYLLVGFMDIKL